MAHRVDPKVYFSNERTYLKWLHTSVTVGAIASALLGFASYGDDAESSGTKPIKVVGLVLLVPVPVTVVIGFDVFVVFCRCCHYCRRPWAKGKWTGCLPRQTVLQRRGGDQSCYDSIVDISV